MTKFILMWRPFGTSSCIRHGRLICLTDFGRACQLKGTNSNHFPIKEEGACILQRMLPCLSRSSSLHTLYRSEVSPFACGSCCCHPLMVTYIQLLLDDNCFLQEEPLHGLVLSRGWNYVSALPPPCKVLTVVLRLDLTLGSYCHENTKQQIIWKWRCIIFYSCCRVWTEEISRKGRLSSSMWWWLRKGRKRTLFCIECSEDALQRITYLILWSISHWPNG